MIIPSKVSQVEKIKKYIETNADKYTKCIIFGKCTTEDGTPEDYLDIAIETADPAMADDDDKLYDLYYTISKATDGLFDITIINSDQYRDLTNEIEKGEKIYG